MGMVGGGAGRVWPSILMNIRVRTIRTPVRFWQTRHCGSHCSKTVLSSRRDERNNVKRDGDNARAPQPVVFHKQREEPIVKVKHFERARLSTNDLSDVVKKSSRFSIVVYDSA